MCNTKSYLAPSDQSLGMNSRTLLYATLSGSGWTSIRTGGCESAAEGDGELDVDEGGGRKGGRALAISQAGFTGYREVKGYFSHMHC